MLTMEEEDEGKVPTMCWARVTHMSCRFILRTTWEAGAAVTHSAQENEADGVRPAVPASGQVRLGLQDSGRQGWGGGTLKRGSSQLGGFMRILIGLAATSSLRNQKEVDDEEKAETLPGLVSGGPKGWGRGVCFHQKTDEANKGDLPADACTFLNDSNRTGEVEPKLQILDPISV